MVSLKMLISAALKLQLRITGLYFVVYPVKLAVAMVFEWCQVKHR